MVGCVGEVGWFVGGEIARGWRHKGRGAVALADGGEAGKAGTEAGAATGFLGHEDFVKEADGWVAGGECFSVMNKFIEGWAMLDIDGGRGSKVTR